MDHRTDSARDLANYAEAQCGGDLRKAWLLLHEATAIAGARMIERVAGNDNHSDDEVAF